MVIMKRLLVLFVLLSPLVAVGQQRQGGRGPEGAYNTETVLLGSYDGLYSQGPMPKDLLLSYEQLYSLDKQRAKRLGVNVNNTELQNVSYQISRMMAGGEIMYGDPVTQMIERIADTLLRDYPQLRDSLRFYTVKSSSVNAFSTGQGMIFVTLGMVAKSESEAALAFALSHEIAHYYRNHTWVELDSRHNTLDTNNLSHYRFLTYHQRSRAMESEADSLSAMLFYGKSRYWKGVTDQVFDMLQYAYLPFANPAFDTDFFNTPNYRLPRQYYLDEVQPISAREDYNDSLSTHPNVLKRRMAVHRMMDGDSGERFIVTTPEEFVDIQTLARWECMRQDLIAGNYARAFYNAYTEYMQAPDAYERYPEKVMCQSLYAIAKHKVYADNNNALKGTDRVEGEEQQVLSLFRKIGADEMAMVAVRYLWQHQGKDPQLEALTEDLRGDLFGRAGFSRDYFLDDLNALNDNKNPDVVNDPNDKYAAIRQRNREVRQVDARRFYFTDLLQSDTAFHSWLLRHPELDKKEANAESTGRRIMVLHPTYLVMNDKTDRVKVRESLRGERRLERQAAAIARSLNAETVTFQNGTTKPQNTETYNDYVRLNEWVSENNAIDDNVEMIQSVSVAEVAGRYNADYVTLPLVINSENRTDISSNQAFLRLLYLVVYPMVLADHIDQDQRSLAGALTVNTHTGATTVNGRLLCTDYNLTTKQLIYENFSEAFGKKKDGFLGRKVTLGAGLTLSPTFLGGRYLSYEMPVVDLRPTVAIQYSMGPQTALCLQGDYSDIDYNLSNTAHFDQARTFSFFLALRRSQYSAYISDGIFSGPLLSYAHINLNAPDDAAFGNTYHRFGIGYELGQSRMLTDRLSLSLVLRYHITLCKFWSLGFDDRTSNLNLQLMTQNFVTLGMTLGFKPF